MTVRRPLAAALLTALCGAAPPSVLTLAAAPALAQEAAPGGSGDTIRFAIARFEVRGNSVLDDAEIAALLAPFAGEGRDFGSVQRALEALQGRYRERGYGSVQVWLPEQSLDAGTIVLQVTEPRVAAVRVSGNAHFSAENIRRAVPSAREGAVPNTRRLSDEIRVANESPMRQLRVVLRPAAEADQVDLLLEAADQKPWRVFATADNTGTRQTGRWRTGLGVQHANLFDRDHIVTAQYITAPGKLDQVSVYSLGYRVPLYGLGDSLDVFAGYSDVDAGRTETPAGPLEFSGNGTVAGVRYNFLLARVGETEGKVILGADYRRYDNVCSVGVLGAAGCGSAAASVTVHPVSLGFAARTTGASAQSDVALTVLRNIPGGSKGRDADFLAARAGADADYTIVRTQLAHARAFGGDWQFRFAYAGQWTTDALIQSEQFGATGFNAVRGFLEREVSGDRGFAVNLELFSPNLAALAGIDDALLRVLLFADMGRVDKRNPQPGDTQVLEGVSSYGLGLRLSIGRNLSLRTDYAVVYDAGGSQQRDDARVHAGIVATF